MYNQMIHTYAELMQLADQHQELDLVKRCEVLIIHGITTDNALNLITLATKYTPRLKV